MGERFETLDGMRGIAAISVLVYHAEMAFGLTPIPTNGPLAVDFFFCLSGFVLASAHDHQFAAGTLPVGRFMAMRFVRIAPMVAMGTILGALSLPILRDLWAPPPELRLPTIVLSFFATPFPARGILFTVNGVFWSLFAELVVNAIYGVWGRRLSNRLLGCLIGLFGIAFLAIAVRTHNTDFHLEKVAFLVPTICRAGFGFFVGIALFRFRHAKPRPRTGSLLVPIALLVMMVFAPMVPHIGLFNLTATFVLIPIVVLLGASAAPQGSSWASMLGGLSFPLYAIHSPILAIVGTMVVKYGLGVRIALGICICAAILALARFTDLWIDRAARKWLSRHLLGRRVGDPVR